MRTFDPTIHNWIANQPGIFEAIGGKREDHAETQGLMLFGGAIEMRDTYVFLHNEEKDAAMIFEQSAPGVFEQHTMFLPSCRGKRAIKEGKKLIHEMFTEHGAVLIWGKTPKGNKAARLFNRWMGAETCGYRSDPQLGECELFRGFKASWLKANPAE